MKTTIQTATATGYRGNRFENADPSHVAELAEAMLAERRLLGAVRGCALRGVRKARRGARPARPRSLLSPCL